MLKVNDPAVLSEIAELHDAYERALIANDIQALNTFFWDSPEIVRFGVNEHLYGAQEVAAYRQGNKPVFSERKLLRRTIVTLNADMASVMSEISQIVAGQLRHVRQSQVWARLPELGWKVIAAHVSTTSTTPAPVGSWDAYVDQTAAALKLPLTSASRSAVVKQLETAAAIAAPLLATSLSSEIEVAAVFTP